MRVQSRDKLQYNCKREMSQIPLTPSSKNLSLLILNLKNGINVRKVIPILEAR